MRDRPFSLKFVAFFYLAVAVGLPLQIAILFGHGLGELTLIAQKMTSLNWSIFTLSLLSATLIWIGHKSVKYLLPLNMVLVALNNWSVAEYGDDYSESLTIASTLLFTMFNSILLFGRGLDAILDPNLQWWRVSERIHCQQRALISTNQGELLEAAIFDISKTGLFLEQLSPKLGQALAPGDHVRLGLALAGHEEPLVLNAKVVRKAEATGHYPKGLGLCFESLKLKERFALLRYIKEQQRAFALTT